MDRCIESRSVSSELIRHLGAHDKVPDLDSTPSLIDGDDCIRRGCLDRAMDALLGVLFDKADIS